MLFLLSARHTEPWQQVGFRKPSPRGCGSQSQGLGTWLSPATGRAKFHQSVGADGSSGRCPKEGWASKQEERQRRILARRKKHSDADRLYGQPGPRHDARMTVRVTRGRPGVMGTEASFPCGKDQDLMALIPGHTLGLTRELLKKSGAPEILV